MEFYNLMAHVKTLIENMENVSDREKRKLLQSIYNRLDAGEIQIEETCRSENVMAWLEEMRENSPFSES